MPASPHLILDPPRLDSTVPSERGPRLGPLLAMLLAVGGLATVVVLLVVVIAPSAGAAGGCGGG
jgi:hypothetical protein